MINPKKLKPFGYFCKTIGMIPTSYKMSLTYEEQLLWLCDFLENKVIPAYDNNAKALEELQNLYIQLKEYVDKYFEDLSVQEEINNKLDEMVESGQLADIITRYLEIGGLLCYNTLADLKNATNISNGSFTKTFGNLLYNDGKGEFYKIRTLKNTDVIDETNIIALNNFDNLIAELMHNFTIDQILQSIETLNNQISSLNTNINTIAENVNGINEDIEDLNNIINNSKNKLINKIIKCKNSYTPELDLNGENSSLSFEIIGENNNTFSHQGLCINKKTGEIYGNDKDKIFKLVEKKPLGVVNLFTNLNMYHGGDCFIENDKMYIVDSNGENINNINIINLNNGNIDLINIPSNKIENTQTDGVPVCGGICKFGNNIYIGVIDLYTNDHTIYPSNSTIRIYKYINNDFIKVFETPNSLCYLQGMTVDNDFFYICGNKPFSSDYSGNKIFIINNKDFELLDTIENNINREFEGLDYASLHGVEGLLTSINKYGEYSRVGLYSFYGNVTKLYQDISSNITKTICVSRGGSVHVHYENNNLSITGGTTYSIDNFLNNILSFPVGLSGSQFHGFGNGGSRSDIIAYGYNSYEDKLYIWPVNNITSFKCDFDLISF